MRHEPRAERLRARSAVLALLGPWLLWGLACTSAPPVPDAFKAVSAAPKGAYRIGANDQLQISVWRQPELSLQSVVVRPDGRISVPLLDDVEAAGRTPEELKEVITSRLAEFILEPDVTVVVLESRSQIVIIQGEVARKGPLPLVAGMRIADAIAFAGGFGPFADPKRIIIIREVSGQPQELQFDYKAWSADPGDDRNVLLQAGDRIVVPESTLF